jgi:hypothetical protein
VPLEKQCSHKEQKEMNMSSKPKGDERKELHAIPSQEAEKGESSVAKGGREEEIRRRAYEIYSNAANNQAGSWTIGRPSAGCLR